MKVTIKPKDYGRQQEVKRLGPDGWVVLTSSKTEVTVVKENHVMVLKPEEIL